MAPKGHDLQMCLGGGDCGQPRRDAGSRVALRVFSGRYAGATASGDPEFAHLAVEGVATDAERPSRVCVVAARRAQGVGHRLSLG